MKEKTVEEQLDTLVIYQAIGTPEQIKAVIERARAILDDDQERRDTYPGLSKIHPHRELVMDNFRAALKELKVEP